MVIELVVLFRIENLKQCRRRIAPEILTKLVDFIEQEQRVHRPRFFQIGRDLTGHRTNIGPAMATNLCFIAHAAKRLTDKLTPRCLRNRFAKRRLTHAGRADEAQDWALKLVGACLHRKIFDDAVLDLFQSEMVLIKNVLRLGDITLQLGLFAPWYAQKRVEIIAHDGRLGGHGCHAAQLFQFGIGFRLCFLGQLHRVDLVLNLGNFVAAFAIVIAQLALDGLHLFVQIIFALGLFHLALHAATDFLFDLQYAQFAFHEGKRHFQPAKRIRFNQKRLLIRHL